MRGEPRAVVSPDVLDRMTDAMTHRGPNDRGTYLAEGIALGVRRLSIVDVEGGHQPFANEDGSIWAVQNGELYNHDDVRAGLRARRPPLREPVRHGDPPAPLRGASAPAFPEQLRGKFGIALWDGRERRAVIARDRLGVKPLYYAEAGDLLVFASELKSLLASGLVDDRPRLRGDRRVPHARVRARPDDAARGRPQAACPGTGWSSTAAARASRRTGATRSPRPSR